MRTGHPAGLVYFKFHGLSLWQWNYNNTADILADNELLIQLIIMFKTGNYKYNLTMF